jgi:hypothetical protein
MSDLVRMKALRPWANRDHEGQVSDGDEFDATEDRARELERIQFATRIAVEAEERTESSVELAREEIGEHPERRRARSKRG